MKRPLLPTKRHMISAVVCNYPGGRQGAATRLGMSLKQLDNQIYENSGSRPLSNDAIHTLEQDTGTTCFPEYVSAQYGGLFVPLANPETLDNVEMYSRSVAVAAKRGVVDLAIAEALDDGVIEPAEGESILAAHRSYMAARHAEVLATLQLHSEGKHP